MVDYNVFKSNSFFYPLKDNTYLCFKTLGKDDREKFIEGFKKLSKKSIYKRFFGFMKELTEKQIGDFLDTDKKDHLAWAALDIKGDDVIGVGVGRFKRSATNPHEAELALTVIDEYQGTGVGTVLLAIMYYLASSLEIEILTGIMLAENSNLIRRFKGLGAEMTRRKNEYSMRLPVHKDFDKIPGSNYTTILKTILHFLKENDFQA
jgi:acetyltransferase